MVGLELLKEAIRKPVWTLVDSHWALGSFTIGCLGWRRNKGVSLSRSLARVGSAVCTQWTSMEKHGQTLVVLS